jgi:hypothetical protein
MTIEEIKDCAIDWGDSDAAESADNTLIEICAEWEESK